jgi:hypothetical protein
MKQLTLILLLTTLSLVTLAVQPLIANQGGDDIHLPLILNSKLDCNVPGVSYNTFPVIPPPTDRPAEEHADLNLALRDYEPVTADLELQDYGGDTDPDAPQLDTLFTNPHLPTFTAAYQVHHWDWNCNCQAGLITNPPVTHLAMAVVPGEIIHVPDSGYHIGGGNDVLVLYASENRITLKYTGEDNVVQGYTIHIENICIEPDLLALYRNWNEAGRAKLPALPGGKALGRAFTGEISLSVRDNGTFLDPRSRKDWWKDY